MSCTPALLEGRGTRDGPEKETKGKETGRWKRNYPIETAAYDYFNEELAPWVVDYAASITSAAVVDDGIKPVSLATWFISCENLSTISLGKLDTSATTDMGIMFSECHSLTSLSSLEKWDTSAATSMLSPFSECLDLTDISALSAWNVSSVTDMGNFFNGCTSLTDLSPIAGWVTSSVTNMQSMFDAASSATGDLSGWDVAAVTNHDNFCFSTDLVQPNWVS